MNGAGVGALMFGLTAAVLLWGRVIRTAPVVALQRAISPGRPELDELASDVRVKVGKLLSDLEARGYTWRVLDVARTLDEQALNVERGYSRTINSRHVAEPGAARAVDLEPVLTPAGPATTDELRAQAYLALRDTAPRYGLETGGIWLAWSSKWAEWGLGGDPGHVQEATS